MRNCIVLSNRIYEPFLIEHDPLRETTAIFCGQDLNLVFYLIKCLSFFLDPVVSGISVYDTVTQSRCPTRQFCSGSGITAFQPNHEYSYDYEVETLSQMRGSSDSNESKLKFKARAVLYIKSACDYILKVKLGKQDSQI